MSKVQMLVLAAVLVVVGIGLMVMPTPGEPKLECVAEGAPSSGFADADQDDCPVSQASYARYSDWESGPKWDNIGGLVLVVAGLGTGITALVRKRRPVDPAPA